MTERAGYATGRAAGGSYTGSGLPSILPHAAALVYNRMAGLESCLSMSVSAELACVHCSPDPSLGCTQDRQVPNFTESIFERVCSSFQHLQAKEEPRCPPAAGWNESTLMCLYQVSPHSRGTKCCRINTAWANLTYRLREISRGHPAPEHAVLEWTGKESRVRKVLTALGAGD